MTDTRYGDAQRRALRLYPKAKNFRSTYLRGARARLAGRPADACPYPLDRTRSWRLAYRRAWLRGWEDIPVTDEE